jgi:hypothetical protein
MKSSCCKTGMMKKIVLCTLLLPGLLALSCKKEKPELTEDQLPEPVVNSFTAQYPNANEVDWDVKKQKNPDAYENKELIIYEAEFTYNSQAIEAKFDEGGNLVEEDK